MTDVVKFGLLGLGAAGVYALLAFGVVLVYRGSGVVNFAQGGFALVGGYAFYDLRDAVPTAAAAVLAVAIAAAFGLFTELAVMWPMRHSSPLARVIATLGILAAITQGAQMRYGPDQLFVAGFLPTGSVEISDSIVLSQDRLWLFGIAIVLMSGLWITYRATRFGLATSAVAEHQDAAAALGWSPRFIAAVNWTAGAALAGLAGVLLTPISSLSPDVLALAIVPALSAALVGGFSSFPLTLAGAVLIGVLESEAQRWVTSPGSNVAVPFLVIVAILVARGKALPVRNFLSDRLPAVGTGELRPGSVATAVVLAFASVAFFSPRWSVAITISAILAIVGLSLVVVTGYAGQISLAQYSLAGVGALVSSQLADALGAPFPLALALGVVCTVPVGIVVALPALRARGVNLAVATLAMALVIQQVVLGNPSFTGGIDGITIDAPEVFGWSVASVTHPERYAVVCTICFAVLAVVVANLRRSRAGRELLAVRDNERAAASIGVSVIGAKVFAFAIAAGIAAVAGGLAAFRSPSVEFSQFSVLQSITIVMLSVIGGIGYVVGAAVAGVLAVGGVVESILHHFFDLTDQWQLILGLFLVVQVVFVPDGVVHHQVHAIRALTTRLHARRSSVTAPSPAEISKVPPKRLALRNIAVQFGGTRALDGLSLVVHPGEVVGLIGPNGAGKTTLIDVATGFVNPSAGEIAIDDVVVNDLTAHQRARRGLMRSWQSLELFEVMTVEENLRTAAGRSSLWSRLGDLVWPRREPFSPITSAAIHEFDLGDVLGQRPDQLPYAVRRLVGIARSVATAPSILLLDEPAAGLDDLATDELALLIRRLATDWGMAIVLVEHDVSMVMRTCHRVVAIDFGREVAAGTPDEVRSHPLVIESYLGTDTADEGDSAAASPGSLVGRARDD